MILSFILDSRYGSTGITKALITAFGNHSLMFDVSAGGTKVAVVATTTEDSSTCIFTNYNGPSTRPQNCGMAAMYLLMIGVLISIGYNLIRPEDQCKELLVWQA